MGRKKKTRTQYMREYWRVIDALKDGLSYRKIAEKYGVGISTVVRVKKIIFEK